jgi:hypothetical protein
MMMVRILSIDCDYFIAASAQERDLYFPRGGDEIPHDTLRSIWKARYLQYPQLADIDVIEQFQAVKNHLILANIKEENFFRSSTHKSIKDIIDKLPEHMPLRIVNIDFHHDYYHYYSGGNYCNCGNWLRRVIEERPETEVKWIRRADSELCSLEGEFPYEHDTDITSVFDEVFDLVFICQSPEWSPPHLYHRYEELVRAALHSGSA